MIIAIKQRIESVVAWIYITFCRTRCMRDDCAEFHLFLKKKLYNVNSHSQLENSYITFQHDNEPSCTIKITIVCHKEEAQHPVLP